MAIRGWGGRLYFGFGECCLSSGTHHPSSPLPSRKGEEIKALWGTPPDPRQRGYPPLHSLLVRPVIARSLRRGNLGWGGVLYFGFGECCLNSGTHHPPSPLPSRKGEEIKALWGTPPDPRQRGYPPLHSLLVRPVIARSLRRGNPGWGGRLYFGFGECCLSSGTHHPSSPLPSRKGKK